MAHVTISKDLERKQVTVESEVNADRQQVWNAWTDGASLEKWWGPQGWPATTTSFDFKDGGHWHYKMTGPDGTEAWSRLDYLTIDPINGFTARDCFSDEQGTTNEVLPITDWQVTFTEADGKTRVVTTITLSSDEQLEKLVAMGFESGYTESLENLDKYLAGVQVYQ